jgi:hypothetical protein
MNMQKIIDLHFSINLKLFFGKNENLKTKNLKST